MNRKIQLLNKLLEKGTVTKFLAVLCVALLSVSVVPHTLFPAHASDFTVSNVTFDPTTGRLSFDYTGTAQTYVSDIDDPTVSTTYWSTPFSTNCTSSHCDASLDPYTSDSGVTSVVIRGSAGISQTLNYPLPLPTTNTPQTTIAGGWTGVGETWTYASADSPTYTFTVSGDETGRYSLGMRIKLTQSSTTKYFIITAVSYSSPNTTVTVYGGTDYTLANSTISNTYYSMVKAPQGFPLDPAKWTEEVKDSTYEGTSSPSSNTWYNADNITIPIGVWNVSYQADLFARASAIQVNEQSTLSTSNNSESDADFRGYAYQESQGATTTAFDSVNTRMKTLNISSKTTYYLNYQTTAGGVTDLGIAGSDSKTIIRAVSAYL
jgi:hypothetical protein